MGTRADFYVGKGKDAEWLGSIAWDGYRSGIPGYILKATREEDFRKAVEVFLTERDDARFAKDGWPWPWNTSEITDCSYWFFDGACHDEWGGCYARCDQGKPEEGSAGEPIAFPDMSARKNVTDGGFIVLRSAI